MSLLEEAHEHLSALSDANERFALSYPGEPVGRQPVHTVYGGAHLFKAGTIPRLGQLARESMQSYGKDPVEFALGVGFVPEGALEGVDPNALERTYQKDAEGLRQRRPFAWLAARVHERVLAKLHAEPVEDFRIDFEDGFGARSDDEEDAAAHAAGLEVALGMNQRTLPPFLGIRIKTLSQ